MWLASISKVDRIAKRTDLAKDWSERVRARADQILDAMLSGVGDPARERSFSMCVTHCRHRAVSDAELERLPESFRCGRPTSIAGGPVVVHWTRGLDETLTISSEPCEHISFGPHPTMGIGSFPIDCGGCPPCRAREIAATTGKPCSLTREELARGAAP